MGSDPPRARSGTSNELLEPWRTRAGSGGQPSAGGLGAGRPAGAGQAGGEGGPSRCWRRVGSCRPAHVLDVATGTETITIVPRRASAQVVASTSPRTRRRPPRARARGTSSSGWKPTLRRSLLARASSLYSSVGAIFPPSHQRVADELLRVCRPGGAILEYGHFAPPGLGVSFGLNSYMPPPPPGALPLVMWGSEERARALRRPDESLRHDPQETPWRETRGERPAVLRENLRARGCHPREPADQAPGRRVRPRTSSSTQRAQAGVGRPRRVPLQYLLG